MFISAVGSGLPVQNGFKTQNKFATNVVKSEPIKEDNKLVDMNYGKSLVNFSGLNNKLAYDLSDKVSAAYSMLKKNDILLVGKDLASAKKSMISSADSFNDVIKNVFFVAAPALTGVLAIKKNNSSFDELYNLSDSPLFVKRNENTPLANSYGEDSEKKSADNPANFFFLNKNERPAVLLDFDTISFKEFDNGFVLDKYISNASDIFADGYISEINMPSVVEINKMNLQKIKTEEAKDEKQIKLSDVGGQDEAINQLKQKVLFPIKYPNFFDKNLSGFNSALLVGPPGTGKTLTAMALANEAGIPFYNMNGQLLEGKYVGESSHNIDNYYEMVKKNQPCILFFDEADAIFSKRTGEHKYADDSVNMHLDKISELEKEGAKVFMLAATNFPERMDEGVLRNGRFGTKIEFKAPNTVEKCEAIFDIHSKSLSVENLDKTALSKKMLDANFNGADIAALVTEAKFTSIERQGIFEKMSNGTYQDDPNFILNVTEEDFDKAFDKMISNKQAITKAPKGMHITGFSMQ